MLKDNEESLGKARLLHRLLTAKFEDKLEPNTYVNVREPLKSELAQFPDAIIVVSIPFDPKIRPFWVIALDADDWTDSAVDLSETIMKMLAG